MFSAASKVEDVADDLSADGSGGSKSTGGGVGRPKDLLKEAKKKGISIVWGRFEYF